MAIEKHHVIPLAIWGGGNKENILALEKETHKLVHQVLNIPYRHIRRYRSTLNWKVVLDDNVIETERAMQLAYYKNVDWLPKEVFKLHYNNIAKQALRKPEELITYKDGAEQIKGFIDEINDTKLAIIALLWEQMDIEALSWNRLFMKLLKNNNI